MAENKNQVNAPVQEDMSELLKIRREKLAALQAEGRNPFEETRYEVTHHTQDIKDEFDYVFIDCPPSLGLLTINALVAADSLLIPIQCEYYALEGLSQLLNTVKTIKRLYNPSIDLEGVVLTMFDNRLNLTQQVVAEVKKYFPNKVFETAIPRNVRLSEAPSFGMPVLYYDRGSRGSMAYIALARELIKKNAKR